MCFRVMENEFAGRSKLGPREKGRKAKGRKKPQAARQARKRRDALVSRLTAIAQGSG